MCSGPNAVNERVEYEFADLVCKRCRQHTITIRPLVHDWLINSWGREFELGLPSVAVGGANCSRPSRGGS